MEATAELPTCSVPDSSAVILGSARTGCWKAGGVNCTAYRAATMAALEMIPGNV